MESCQGVAPCASVLQTAPFARSVTGQIEIGTASGYRARHSCLEGPPDGHPQTTYQIVVVNTTISGSSPASAPISTTTVPASVPPSAPSGVTAYWTNLDPAGTTDMLVASWEAAVPGDSPIDQYRITIIGSDGTGTFTQMVSGTTLTASFTVDYIPNWSVTVQAQNAVGWGPSSSFFGLGGL